MSESVKKELLCAHTEFMEHPVAIKTSFSPTAKMGPTCSRRYTHKKQRAFSWAASRSKLHPQRSQLSTEDSVFCIHLIPLERVRGKKRNWYFINLGFQRTQEVPWFQADLLWCGQATTIILRHPRKKRVQTFLYNLSQGLLNFQAWHFSLHFTSCLHWFKPDSQQRMLQIQRQCHGRIHYCYRLKRLCPPKSICWNLIPHVMVLGGGALGRWLGHKDGVPENEISVLVKEARESSLTPSTVGGQRTDRLSMDQEVGPHQTLNLLQSPTFQPPELWEMSFCCF